MKHKFDMDDFQRRMLEKIRTKGTQPVSRESVRKLMPRIPIPKRRV